VDPELARAVSRALGERVVSARAVPGGDINEAWRIGLGSELEVFVKTNASAPPGFFAREAEGLRWLAEARALRVPRVRAVGEAPAFLALEWLEPGPPMPGHDEALGRGLAALHRSGAEAFGFARDNYIGSLPQANTPRESWPAFYAERRLRPLMQRAQDVGVLPRSLASPLEALIDRLPDLTGPTEPPARLHGDLWGGNLHRDVEGAPCLVDPAVYGGHREVDLAMLRLFGGASERTFDAYDEAIPLAPGTSERVALYQLYPLLVHVNLFGAGYLGSLQAAVERYA
jgi:fructosamine-3-kinase